PVRRSPRPGGPVEWQPHQVTDVPAIAACQRGGVVFSRTEQIGCDKIFACCVLVLSTSTQGRRPLKGRTVLKYWSTHAGSWPVQRLLVDAVGRPADLRAARERRELVGGEGERVMRDRRRRRLGLSTWRIVRTGVAWACLVR